MPGQEIVTVTVVDFTFCTNQTGYNVLITELMDFVQLFFRQTGSFPVSSPVPVFVLS